MATTQRPILALAKRSRLPTKPSKPLMNAATAAMESAQCDIVYREYSDGDEKAIVELYYGKMIRVKPAEGFVSVKYLE